MFEVKRKCCGQCLFSKNKIVSGARKTDVLKGCAESDAHFICHKASMKGKDICCKGFYDTQTSNMIRISQRMGWINFVD